ncbi:hypothetical protein GCM10027589_55440 [Actinocorallia lasiicapitis]
MTVATLAAAKTIDNGGFTMHPLAVPSRGSTELAMWRITAEPGARSLEHSVDHEELFYVQSGSYTATIDGVPHAAGPGDALICPPHTPFFLENTGTTEAVVVAVSTAGLLGSIGETTINPPWAQ